MQILRQNEYRTIRWPNGGGTARNILDWPSDREPAHQLWRLSIATVDQDADFSIFPCMERLMMVLSGAGLRLDISNAREAVLTAQSAALRFPGDVPTRAQLIGGPVTNLNLMVRRPTAAKMFKSTSPRLTAPADGQLVIFALQNLCVRSSADGSPLCLLETQDSLVLDAARPAYGGHRVLECEGDCIIAEIGF